MPSSDFSCTTEQGGLSELLQCCWIGCRGGCERRFQNHPALPIPPLTLGAQCHPSHHILQLIMWLYQAGFAVDFGLRLLESLESSQTVPSPPGQGAAGVRWHRGLPAGVHSTGAVSIETHQKIPLKVEHTYGVHPACIREGKILILLISISSVPRSKPSNRKICSITAIRLGSLLELSWDKMQFL